jgi:hypothetical protein
METFEHTAYHEAAHAVIGIVLGKRVQEIIMHGEQHGHEMGAYGGCRFKEQDSEWTDEDYVTMRYAGGRAEYRLCEQRGWNVDEALTWAADDLLTARDRTLHLEVHHQKALFDEALRRTEELLDLNWLAIEALAAILPVEGIVLRASSTAATSRTLLARYSARWYDLWQGCGSLGKTAADTDRLASCIVGGDELAVRGTHPWQRVTCA